MPLKWRAGKYNVHTAVVGQFMIQLEWSSGKWFYTISLLAEHRRSADSGELEVAKANAEAKLRQILDSVKE